jgi:biotin/methionine sulfoxide reductase
VIAMATGAWFDPDQTGGPERHGNPNVLTLDIGTSRLAQGPSALSVLVEVERYAEMPGEVEAWTPPAIVPRGAVSQ